MDEKVLERFRQADGFQNHKGSCIICERPFVSCKHNVGDLAKVLKAYRELKR